jgi:hypothetical protein
VINPSGFPIIPSPLVGEGKGGGNASLSRFETAVANADGFVAQDSDTPDTTHENLCDISTSDATNQTRIPHPTAGIRLVTFRPWTARCDIMRSPATYPRVLRQMNSFRGASRTKLE